MRDEDCVAFLQWALPLLHMRWEGFRKVRGQVCKRISRRIKNLGIENSTEYRDFLTVNEKEWKLLDGLCRVSISRFYRDKMVYSFLEQEVLPVLAQQSIERNEETLKVWCVGCSSGEEPYTVSLLWKIRLQSRFPGIEMDIRASDADSVLIQRATVASYSYATIKNLPDEWRQEAFTRTDDDYLLKPEYRRSVRFSLEDVRVRLPDEKFDLVFCRNLVFTYFDEALQHKMLEQLRGVLRTNGVLVIGVREKLPESCPGFSPWSERLGIYRTI